MIGLLNADSTASESRMAGTGQHASNSLRRRSSSQPGHSWNTGTWCAEAVAGVHPAACSRPRAAPAGRAAVPGARHVAGRRHRDSGYDRSLADHTPHKPGLFMRHRSIRDRIVTFGGSAVQAAAEPRRFRGCPIPERLRLVLGRRQVEIGPMQTRGVPQPTPSGQRPNCDQIVSAPGKPGQGG